MVAAGLLITVLIGINAHRTIQRLTTTNSWLIHTHLVLNKTQRIQALMTTLDNDLRAHLLSNNPYFKTDFKRNSAEMADQLKKLLILTGDNPIQQKRVRTLNALFQQKVVRGTPLFEEGAVVAGKARLDSTEAYLNLSNSFQQTLKAIDSYESVLLESRTTQSERSAEQATINSLIGAVASLVMIIWAMYLLFQSLRDSTTLNRQLAESEQQLKKILEAVPVSVVVVNKDGKFYYANQAATALFEPLKQADSTAGYTDLLHNADVYQYPGGQPYPVEKRPTYRALRGETAQVDDMEIKMGDKAIQILSSASPINDTHDVLQYVVTSSLDISERVQSQRRLQEAKEMAEKAAKLQENFLANMSHEIRTPLNAMLGFSDLLESTTLDREQQEFVSYIQTAGKNLLTIVNDILDISKIEAGMIQLESIPFSFNLLVASLKTMVQSSVADKNLNLVVDTDPTLPAVLLGDPTRLTQILLNLLGNAIKFTKEGTITVHINKKEITNKQVWVEISVEDTGIGIEADALPHIFERFRQATDFTTRFYGGTGLGLNIVKSLIELQGGRITVESTPGKGSRFIVEIAYEIAPESMNPGKKHRSGGADSGEGAFRILVVEDNLMNQKLALQVLKRFGYQAEVAENGQKALTRLEESMVDLILMDIQMPVMDGYETTHHIRNRLRSSVPIIAMTAHALASEREQCLKAGMNDFLPKPFRVDDLQTMIRKYLPVMGTNGVDNEKPSEAEALQPAAIGFSIDTLLTTIGDDMEFAAELLELYLNQTPGELEKIRNALGQNDLPAVGRLIHTQKAQTKMLGLTEATQLILDMEAMLATNVSVADFTPFVDQYITAIEKALLAIDLYVKTKFNSA